MQNLSSIVYSWVHLWKHLLKYDFPKCYANQNIFVGFEMWCMNLNGMKTNELMFLSSAAIITSNQIYFSLLNIWGNCIQKAAMIMANYHTQKYSWNFLRTWASFISCTSQKGAPQHHPHFACQKSKFRSTINFEWCSCSQEVLWIFLGAVDLHWIQLKQLLLQ